MATHGWRQSPSVGEWLEAEGERFDFFQAVALVEGDAPSAASAGTGPSPRREVVSLRSSIAMSFPAADIERVRQGEKKTEITVRMLGLAGVLGPLPPPFAELVARRAAHHDFALRDFLDIFNHRLLSIFYRLRKRHRIGLGARSPVSDDTARYLFSLIGLGTPGLRHRLQVPDRSLLHYAGLLARPVCTMAGLEVLLRRHFGIAVAGKPLTGQLCTIEPEDRTAIGRGGNRRALGRDAMIGQRVWIQDAAFELALGPLPHSQITRYLPGGDALRPLCAAIDMYAGDVTGYSLKLMAEPGSVEQARLGKSHGARLGYTAWLGPKKVLNHPRAQRVVHLSIRTLAPFRGRAPEASPGAAAAGEGGPKP